jgi:oxysterol-binding protein-related protein 3/6/7
MKCVAWTGKCDADKVSMGKYDVVASEASGDGMYGLVFDNTFSKQVAKTATFVLMTYDTSAPPTSGHHLHYSQEAVQSSSTLASATKSSGKSPALGVAQPPGNIVSMESLPQLVEGNSGSLKSVMADPRPRSKHATESKSFGGSTFYTGVMHKRRRKHNSYAKRFFSLDFTTGTLSYYQNRHSSALRGAIPLSLAAVGTNERSREISVDSGAEIWHLRVSNQRDFVAWRDALERASRVVSSLSTAGPQAGPSRSAPQSYASLPDTRDWERVETLVGKVSGIRDAVRRLAKDTDPKYFPSSHGNSRAVSPTRSPSEGSFDFSTKEEDQPERRPFWRRKVSGGQQTASSLFKRSVSAQRIPSPSTAPIPVPNGRNPSFPGRQYLSTSPDNSGIHGHCMELLRDLDEVVSDFSTLILESKQRRQPIKALSRKQSLGSVSSDEFFDADDGDTIRSQLLEIRRDSIEDGRESFFDADGDGASDTSEDVSNIQSIIRRRTTEEDTSLFPRRPKDLNPLPLSPISRRSQIPPPKQPPPSLIAFLRKNVGKDFANIAMPASANEPTSGLQRIAEQLEYSSLLDAASTHNDPAMRLLYIAAFAISSFSANRLKDRPLRKPFNPMLGETFELVREDRGFRLLAEKIAHKPAVRMALQADGAAGWTFVQAAAPTQKFWGKSAELNTEGTARVLLHEHAETYAYTLATSFLRNVIAGEKYIEPVSTMTVLNESSGAKAVATFKAGGMFAGRSEEVSVQAFDARGGLAPNGLAGKWTSHLTVTTQPQGQDTGETVWRAGPLSENATAPGTGGGKGYGFTLFAAQMNEITPIEKEKLPPTDSRLRPDQRALEEGNLDEAEGLKARLEERQRGRRRVMEEHGEEWKPKWFVKTGTDGGEEVWRLKSGREGYWEERQKGEWEGVVDVFET